MINLLILGYLIRCRLQFIPNKKVKSKEIIKKAIFTGVFNRRTFIFNKKLVEREFFWRTESNVKGSMINLKYVVIYFLVNVKIFDSFFKQRCVFIEVSYSTVILHTQ